MKWRKENWLLVAAGGIFIVGSLLLLLKSNPNQESARYLLSTIPQVIGTVFVLTVAIMQVVGGSELMTIGDLVKQPEFKTAGGISLVGIVGPLVVLYFDQFCIGTALSLCFSAGNLLVIGWFIWRVAPGQAVAKSLSQLKKEMIDKLILGVASEVLDRLKEVKGIGIEAIDKNERLIVKDACKVIEDVAANENNKYDEVWRLATHLLIALHAHARDKQMFSLNDDVITPHITGFPVKYGAKTNKEWPTIKEYLFKCFKEDLFSPEKRVRLENAKSHTKIDSLSALSSLLLAASAIRRKDLEEAFKKWCEVQEKIIEEFTEAMKNPKLREQYPPEESFALIFNIVSDGIELFQKGNDEEYIHSLDEKIMDFAEVAYKDLEQQFTRPDAAVFLSTASQDNILSLKYRIKTGDLRNESPHWLTHLLSEFRKRLMSKSDPQGFTEG